MEPNKLEKQFKNQLDARKIQPSEMAWNKLDAMLAVADQSNSEQPKQKSKSKFSWLYVAASFAGLVLVGTVYFSQNNSESSNLKNEVVIQNKVAPQEAVVSNNPGTIKTASDEVVTVSVLLKSNSRQNKENRIKENLDIGVPRSKGNQVTAVSEENYSDQKTTIVTVYKEDGKQTVPMPKYISAEKLLAEVTNTKLESKSMEKSSNKTTTMIAVNPSILLQNAETELNQSFRESALNRLNKNFKTIKTVLVNRNYEE